MSNMRKIPDDDNVVKDQASTPSIMDCNVYKPFWVQWMDDGSIMAGEGEDVGEFVLCIKKHACINQKNPEHRPEVRLFSHYIDT